MPDVVNPEKPCTVPAAQGFSVVYKNRFLYSKYDPCKTVLQAVQNLSILPDTLVLCYSPCLWYGFDALLAKLQQNCFIAVYEADSRLHETAVEHIPAAAHDSRVLFFSPDQASLLPDLIQNTYRTVTPADISFPEAGTFRHILRIDLSAGIQFSPALYNSLYAVCEQAIQVFWKNRLTLVKFGRLFSRNLFKNIASLPTSIDLASYMNTVEKPILVAGAGESLEHTLQNLNPGSLSRLCIIAADAALPVFLQHHITPDAVAGMESQLAIEKAYIGSGTKSHPFIFFGDIVSRPYIPEKIQSRACWFASAYDNTAFFRNLENCSILPPVIEPLGSIGLTAVKLALLLRKDQNVPVFVTGLDFSYSAGVTHARGAPAQTARLCNTSRLIPSSCYSAAFSFGTSTAVGKDGRKIITTAALSGYARSFMERFAGTVKLFDAGISGIPLGIPRIREDDIKIFLSSESRFMHPAFSEQSRNNQEKRKPIYDFYDREEKALMMLKDDLSGKSVKAEAELHKELYSLLKEREYLYLHFPDGYRISMDTSFLKRVRAEIDFFLKDIRTARTLLNANNS